jgi:hypothetical protein
MVSQVAKDVGGFVFIALVLAYMAVTINVTKKLNNNEAVPPSSVNYVYTMSSVILVLASIFIILYLYMLWYAYKIGTSGGPYIGRLVFAIFALAYAAAVIDVTRKLKGGSPVATSTISFVHNMSIAGIVLSVCAVVYYGLVAYGSYKNSTYMAFLGRHYGRYY